MTDIAEHREEYDRFLPIAVRFEDDMVYVTMANGLVIGNPLYWHPWLQNARPEQLKNVEMNYFSVYWPDLDEALDTEGMVRGIPSYEFRQAQKLTEDSQHSS